MPQKVKGKRILKNGVTAGYVRQKDGSWRFRFLKGGVATPRDVQRHKRKTRRKIINPSRINLGYNSRRPSLRRRRSNTRAATENDETLAYIYYPLKDKIRRTRLDAVINRKSGLNELIFGKPNNYKSGIPIFAPKVHITLHAEYNHYNKRLNAPAHITWGYHPNKVTIPLYRYKGELEIDYNKWKRNMGINNNDVSIIERTHEYGEGIYLLEILNDVIMGR